MPTKDLNGSPPARLVIHLRFNFLHRGAVYQELLNGLCLIMPGSSSELSRIFKNYLFYLYSKQFFAKENWAEIDNEKIAYYKNIS